MMNDIVITLYNKKDIESFEINDMLILYTLYGLQSRLDIVVYRLWSEIYKSILETILSSFGINLI